MEPNQTGPVENLIDVSSRLIELMTREIEFLKNMQPQEIRALQHEKSMLANAYERSMAALRADPELLHGAERTIKRELSDLTVRFEAVLAENERALRAVKSVSERLLDAIVNTVAEKQAGAAYSATGAIGAAALGRSQAVSMSVNERH